MATEEKKERELYTGKKADNIQRGVCGHLSNMRSQDIAVAISIARQHNPEVQKALDSLSQAKSQ
jgi:hypothetical protein